MARPLILCIDDQPTVLATRKLVLETAKFRVVTAGDVREALQAFMRHEPEAVVLDYSLPAVNGAALAALMKRLKPQVPIMMFSSYVTLPEGALDHVDAFMPKGEGPEAMLKTLKLLIKQKQLKCG
ncbi:MAG: response regulator [Terriglobales bacterium]